MARHIILTLEAPLSAFGAEMVDARGPVRDWPGASLLTGLLANALGLTRGQRDAHSRLQERLDFAIRIDREGTRLRDFQTVQLGQSDQGWTTRGAPEGRAGGAGTYESPHIRERDYLADAVVTVALALRRPAEPPTPDELAAALAEPARPLFLGAYAKADAPTLKARAIDFADPLVMAALGVESVASKPMPDFGAGRRLGFSARLRPIVRTDRDGDRARSRELDVFVAAKLAAEPGETLDKVGIYADWARDQIDEAAAEVESLRIDGLESSDVVRRGRGNGSRPFARIPGHTITVAGILRVTDAGSFAALLTRGLGRHRAFGYGMVLLSPPEA